MPKKIHHPGICAAELFCLSVLLLWTWSMSKLIVLCWIMETRRWVFSLLSTEKVLSAATTSYDSTTH